MAKLELFRSDTLLEISSEAFNFAKEFQYLDELTEDQSPTESASTFALLDFETPIVGQKGQLMIASKLDADIHQNACRLAFSGHLLEVFTEKDYHATQLAKLKIFKVKQRVGTVERVQDEYTVIVRNMMKKETDTSKFERMKVTLSTGETGFIEGAFGKSGKIKVRIPGEPCVLVK